MANTKIINLKRYSKKRVPKKVLKGGPVGQAAIVLNLIVVIQVKQVWTKPDPQRLV